MSKSLKKDAWKFYSQWRKERTYSPALKAEIEVSLKGWWHLVGESGNKKRYYLDVVRRLKLLPYAKHVILNAKVVSEITLKSNIIFYSLQCSVYIKDRRYLVRVILTQEAREKPAFYSVMSRKLGK